jgi:hypothetical protein
MSEIVRCLGNAALAVECQRQREIIMRRKKPGKTLEKAARAIKDSNEFVEHVGNLSDSYRHEHALDAGPRNSAVRQSLRTFQKHAEALVLWLEQADKPSSAEHDALNKMGVVLYGSAGHAHAASKSVLEWLAQSESAATRCITETAGKKSPKHAPRIAAQGLRATFEHHQLKLSTAGTQENPGDAVRLLCLIAKHAGDASLTAQDAKQFLLESGTPRKSR